MNLRKTFFAAGAAAVLGAVAPQAFAEGRKDCEPEILSSSVQAAPNVTAVSGVCLDLADVVSTSGPATTKVVKVEAWVDGAFVPLALGPGTGNVYTKNATTHVLETIAVCSGTDDGDGITTVRITRPYLSKGGKAKSATEEFQVAVAFTGGCAP